MHDLANKVRGKGTLEFVGEASYKYSRWPRHIFQFYHSCFIFVQFEVFIVTVTVPGIATFISIITIIIESKCLLNNCQREDQLPI